MATQRRSRGFAGIWQLEWSRSFRRRRLFVLNVLVPLALVVPIAGGAAPPQHAAVVYSVLFVFFGMFGSAIPLLRDAERGMVRRLMLLPLDPGATLVGRALAGAVIDSLQLLPVCALIALSSLAGGASPWFAAVVPPTLLLCGLLGTWVAALARSVAEGALFAAVCALLLLHASGVFRTPSPASVGAMIENFAPFRALHEIMLDGRVAGVGALLMAVVGLTLVTVSAGRILMRSLARSDGRQ